MHERENRLIGTPQRFCVLEYVHRVGEALGGESHHKAQAIGTQIHRLTQNTGIQMLKLGLVVGGPP
jgi:hypothetical protein